MGNTKLFKIHNKANDVTFTDYPESASNNARRALDWLDENGNPNDCLTPVGFARANQLAKREAISLDTVRRMAAFNRHRQNSDVPYSEGCGGIAWDCWGGTSGIDWAIAKSKEYENEFNEVTIDIDGVIGDYYEGNTVEGIRSEIEAIEEIQAKTINVNLNSLGGDYFEGLAIHAVLARHSAKVKVNIYGATASAGTIIAMAGDRIEMAESALFLIHNVWTNVTGNRKELEALIEELEVMDTSLAKMYAKRTGKTVEAITALMDANEGRGRWLDADEAYEWGFVDKVYKTTKVAAMADIPNDLKDKFPNIKNKKLDMDILDTINEKLDKLSALFNSDEPADEPKEEPTDEPTEDTVTDEQLTEIENRVEGLETVINDYKAKLEAAEANAKELSEANEALKAKVSELENDAAGGIDSRGEGGKVSNEENDRLYSFAKTILKK